MYKTEAVDQIDQGLRSYMIGIYNRMCYGLAITALVAYLASVVPAISSLYQTWLIFPIILAPVVLSFAMAFMIEKIEAGTLRILFLVFCTLMGLSLGVFFIAYTATSIFQAGAITAAMFGAMSLYGYTTKRDLTSIGSFLMMGVIGLIIAGLFNLFFASSLITFIINVAAVIIFTGLTAYDTQKLKEAYEIADDKTMTMGAMMLYMDVINIFIALLQLIGEKKE